MARHNNPKIVIEGEDKSAKAFKGAQENLRNLASSAAVLEGPLGAVAGRINALGAALGRMNPIAIATGVAFAGLVSFQRAAIGVAIEYERELFRISAQLEVLGSTTGFTTDQLEKMADSVARATLASESGVRKAISVLLQFRVGTRENFTDLIKIGQDMSAVFGGDLAANVRKLGRALEDPREGLESLKRFLPELNTEFAELTGNMVENGQAAEAQILIIDKLKARIGSPGEGEGKGLAGQVDSLGQSWRELMKNLAATESFSAAVTGLDSLLTGVNNGLDDALVAQEKFKELQIEILESQEPSFFNKLFGDSLFQKERIAGLRRELVDMRLIREEADRAAGAIQDTADARLRAQDAESKRNAALDREFNLAIAQESTFVAQLKEEEKQLKKLKTLYEAARVSILPPLQKLEEQYKKNSANVAAFQAADGASVEEQQQAQLAQLEAFLQKKSKLQSKFTRTDRLISVLQQQGVSEEDRINETFNRRRAMVESALDGLEQTEIGRYNALTDILLDLERQRGDKLREVMLKRTQDLVGSLGDLAGLAADNFARISSQETQRVNKDFADRADAIKKNVKDGVISVEQGNQRLAALDSQRQSQLDGVARRNFNREKKLRKAQAVAAAAQVILGAMADTNGNVYARIAAGVVAAAAAATQIAAINATQFDGGGSVAPVSAGGGSVAQPAAAQSDPGIAGRLTIIGNQNSSFSFDQLVQIAAGLNELSGRFDIQIVDPESRNANDIISASERSLTV